MRMLFRFIAIAFIALLIGTCDKNSNTKVGSGSLVHPEWSYNATIYELNIRQFSEAGTFNAVTERLNELKELNVEIIWLMPIHPIGELNRKGSKGSYYSVKDYRDVNPEFGTKDDFKILVNKAHTLGMKVILDWVANHTAWDNSLTISNPEWYTRDENGNFKPPVEDWADVIDLNYENNELREYMIESLKYWVREFDIDGYRCDVADMVLIDFWNDVRKRLDMIKPVFMLAEAENPEHHEKAFDMSYGWEMHHVFNDIAQGKRSPTLIKDVLYKNHNRFPNNAFQMHFISNHDENSWNGTVFERLGDAAELFAVTTTILPGMPLIYSGQEAGMNKRLEFFEKDPIEWKEHPMRNLYTQLFQLKQENSALQNGDRGADIEYLEDISDNELVFAFKRANKDHGIFFIGNYSSEPVEIDLSQIQLDGYNNWQKNASRFDKRVTLSAWDYLLLTK